MIYLSTVSAWLHKRRLGLFLGLLLLLTTGTTLFAQVPVITIDSPSGGMGFDTLLTVSGRVESNTDITECSMIANGIERPLYLNDQTFNTLIIAAPGENTIQVVAKNQNGMGRDSVSFFSQIPKRDVKVVLSWDTDGTDVDLWVTTPLGEQCYYQNTSTSIGDSLDVDDTDGFGPETYTLNNAVPGNYQVQAHYYSDNGTPLTEVELWVVLYEGTSREEKLYFTGILRQEGDLLNVANFTIQELPQ